ncbi:unnamed protein product [Dicrocoelium dendriticum]|nr:unnamed protein product [Dicrocoelium dendriticum]
MMYIWFVSFNLLALFDQSYAIVKLTVQLSALALKRENGDVTVLHSNDSCLLLKTRGWRNWISGLFVDCNSSPVRAQEVAPWYPLQLTMDETKFPVEYHKLTTFAKEWQINRLLNVEENNCYTTVILESERPSLATGKSNNTGGYILTGPTWTNVCQTSCLIKVTLVRVLTSKIHIKVL